MMPVGTVERRLCFKGMECGRFKEKGNGYIVNYLQSARLYIRSPHNCKLCLTWKPCQESSKPDYYQDNHLVFQLCIEHFD